VAVVRQRRETWTIFWTLVTAFWAFLLTVHLTFKSDVFWIVLSGAFLAFSIEMLALELKPDLLCRIIGHDWIIAQSTTGAMWRECLRCGQKAHETLYREAG